MNHFCYVLVNIKDSCMIYSYISDDWSVKTGNYVLVPFGKEGRETAGTVKNTFFCAENHAPFPVEKTKHVIRIINRAEFLAAGGM